MIHICMALYDRYGTFSKYMGVTICSIFSSTDEKVTVHVICDETLSNRQREKFVNLAKKYNQKIEFCRLDNSIYSAYKDSVNSFSIGTLFRLSICKVLPKELVKVIYLDADIIVNLDIKSLWNIDISNYPLAAVRDLGVKELGINPWPCKVHIVKYDKYFNAGVMILNMQYLRKNIALEDECLNYILKNPQSSLYDQDALNVFFSEHYLELDGKYNFLSKMIRNHELSQQPCIVHLAGDYVDFVNPHWWDLLFLKYWQVSPWLDEMADYFLKILSVKKAQHDIYRYFASKLSETRKKIVIWGIKSVLWNDVSDIVTIDRTIDYAVDNNSLLWETIVNDLVVHKPDKLLNESKENVAVVVLSMKYYDDIKKQLEEYGFIENMHFFNGQMLLGKVRGYF